MYDIPRFFGSEKKKVLRSGWHQVVNNSVVCWLERHTTNSHQNGISAAAQKFYQWGDESFCLTTGRTVITDIYVVILYYTVVTCSADGVRKARLLLAPPPPPPGWPVGMSRVREY